MTSASTRQLPRALLVALGLAASACEPPGGNPASDAGTNDASSADTADTADTGPVSPCGANGPFGTYTISGGQSGTMACGVTYTAFTNATLTITRGDGGNAALITTTGTGNDDTTNCVATVNECTVTASGCTTGVGSIGFNLMTYTQQISGTAMPYVTAQGGCAFTYSIDGSR